MSERKWTPGPWHYTQHGCVKGGEFQQFERGEAQQQVALATARDDDRQEANAHLIAAAPEMYEALRDAKEWLEGWASAKPQLAVIDAALAKARGES